MQLNLFIITTILIWGLFGTNNSEKYQVSDSLSNTGIIELHEEPVYSTEVLLYKKLSPDCYTMQVSIYADYENGQRLLKHSAMIQSGNGCTGQDKVLNNETYSQKSGTEYIVSDDLLNGPIEDFIKDHEEVYLDFVLKKEKVMGIN